MRGRASRCGSTARTGRCGRTRAVLIPIGVRHRLINDGDEDRLLRLPAQPARAAAASWATSTPSAPASPGRRHDSESQTHRRHRDRGRRAGRHQPEEFWQLLTDGRTATRRISFFDPAPFRSQIAAECDFDPLAAGSHPAGGLPQRPVHPVRRWSPRTRPSPTVASTSPTDERRPSRRSAWAAPSAPPCGWRTSTSSSATTGGTGWSTPRYAHARSSTTRWCRAALPPSWPSGSRRTARRQSSPPAAPPASTRSGYGHQLIEDGDADVVIAGATDAPISPISMACFDAIQATSARNDDPEHASRPFDATPRRLRHGRGRGGARPGGARARPRAGARTIYCEIAGFANRVQRVPHDRAAP